jgi:hypothetical protein
MTATPGTYREGDGSAVAFADAVAAWAVAARPALIDAARRYNRVITYGELGEEVQQRTGIRTRMLLTNWIGKVLGEVAAYSVKSGDILLTALCVHQDGTVGAGYADAVKMVEGTEPEDIEIHAAGTRLIAYRQYATDVPTDGGEPTLTPQETARRKAKASRRVAERPARICPSCFTVLPASGRCDYCD